MPSVVVAFRRPVMMTDRLVSLCAGEYVHSELLVMDEDNPSKCVCYTIFMGERFSMGLLTNRDYNDHDYAALRIHVSEEEREALCNYLNKLVDCAVPYNYSDLANCLLPNTIVKHFLSDVESEDPKRIRSLFCSQAAVLALRNCLSTRHAVFRALWQVNSRSCVPNMLYDLLLPVTEELCCFPLQRGVIMSLHSPLRQRRYGR